MRRQYERQGRVRRQYERQRPVRRQYERRRPVRGQYERQRPVRRQYERQREFPNMIGLELRGFFAWLSLRLTLFVLPDPFLVLVKMPMSGVSHRPHCVCHLGQSPSNNYSGDYCFHYKSEVTTL